MNMKKLKLVLAMMLIMLVTTACTNEESTTIQTIDTPINLALITGEVANSNSFDLSIYDELTEAVYSSGTITVVVPDGEPYIFASLEIPSVSSSYSVSTQEREYSSYLSEVVSMISQAKALTDEVNLIKAINKGASDILSNKNGYDSIMIVSHSGLCTTGTVDFTANLSDKEGVTLYLLDLTEEEIDAYILALKEANELPDLTGVDIIWYGAGDVCGGQEELSGNDSAKLKYIWNSICIASGASSVTFATNVSSAVNDNINLPYVSPVAVSNFEYTTSIDILLKEPLVLDEYSLEFKPNLAELTTDEIEVVAILSDLIDSLISNPDSSIVLCGTTASYGGSQESCEQLSLARAQTIADLLIANGVETSQIECVGLGFENDFYTLDIDESGILIEDIAKTNRSAIILNAASEEALAIISSEEYAR